MIKLPLLFILLVFTFNHEEAFAFGGNGSQSGSIPGVSGNGSITGNSGPCRIRNQECVSSKSHVQIDLAAQCMCVGGTCFEVAIGKFGPKQTRNGTGRIGNAPGGRYRTHRTTVTDRWTNDAVAMGIPQNDAGRSSAGANLPVTSGGKWIHKVGVDSAGNCITPPTRYVTAGCVGVPCSEWDHVKSAMGQAVTVCGGAERDSEIVSVNGCLNRRYCPRDQRRPVHLGCRRAVAMAAARGRTNISCNSETNVLTATPPFPAPPRSAVDDYSTIEEYWRSVN